MRAGHAREEAHVTRQRDGKIRVPGSN
jgi:hypothetical protein